jgi:hypothetical protein
MLKNYVEAVKRLSTDNDGVVSFEYIIVAVCIVTVVGLAFKSGGPLDGALTTGIAAIVTALNTAVTGA